MRTRKYRVWDKENLCFKYSELENCCVWADITSDNQQYSEVMDYVGEDKNGKEIYEGDKVLCGYNEKEKTVIYENYGYYPFSTATGDSCVSCFETNDVEVVGNIYEDSEFGK